MLGSKSPLAAGQLSQVTVTEEPAGSSRLVLPIVPLAWLHLYLKLQQEVLMQTSFRSGVVFLWVSCNRYNDQKRWLLSTDMICSLHTACHRKIHLDSIWCCTTTRCPASEVSCYLLTTRISPLILISHLIKPLVRYFLLRSRQYAVPLLPSAPCPYPQCRTTTAFDLLFHLLQICIGQSQRG